ncbi:MAG: hypothetical protein ABF379_05175 [Akkermansiaceae bacterium]
MRYQNNIELLKTNKNFDAQEACFDTSFYNENQKKCFRAIVETRLQTS